MKEESRENLNSMGTYDGGLSCDVIKDLLPSYVDGICSEDSKKIVEQHLLICKECAALVEALRESEIIEGQREVQQIAYMKKIKKHVGFKEFVGLGILLVTLGFSLQVFAEHYGAISWLYFAILPLMLSDSHFLLSDHITHSQRTEPKIVLTLISGLLLCAGLLVAFISMLWVHQGQYPFGLEAANLGRFLNVVYTFLVICELAIYAVGIALTLKTSNSHSIVISVSMVGLFIAFYILSIFSIMSSETSMSKMLAQSAYLLLEGGCITAIAVLLEKRKLRGN